MEEQISTSLKNALGSLGISNTTPEVTWPTDLSHGDYTTNVALIIAKQLDKTPLEAAEKIVNLLETKYKIPYASFKIAGPGFINFWLSKDTLMDTLKTAEKTISSKKFKNKMIVLEYTDPNPFKEFHIGHLYPNVVGEAFSRLIESVGGNVKRVNYQGDIGLHVAKAIFGMKKNVSRIKEVEDRSLQERVKFLGESYALGTKAYEEDPMAKEEINQINKQVFEQDPKVMPLYQMGRTWSLDYFEAIYKRLGTRFDRYYFESRVAEIGKDIVLKHLKDGIFTKNNDAIVFPGEKYNLHTRVFINSLGLPTYEAKELGLAIKKYDDYNYDASIIVTGSEINDYFKVLLCVLSLIREDLAQKTTHISHGMVRLPSGKMSSRTGEVISAEWLLNEAKKQAEQLMLDARAMGKYSGDEDINAISEQVGVGAVKYAFLKHNIGQDVIFDFKESISFDGNSGPYLQYTFARTQSILSKVQNSEFELKNFNAFLYPFTDQELTLLRLTYRFPGVVLESAENFASNTLCSYLFTLSQSYNFFYQKCPILNAEKTEQKEFRIYVTQKVGEVLEKGLHLLGIEAPEKM